MSHNLFQKFHDIHKKPKKADKFLQEHESLLKSLDDKDGQLAQQENIIKVILFKNESMSCNFG